jgi:hypothetical protein
VSPALSHGPAARVCLLDLLLLNDPWGCCPPWGLLRNAFPFQNPSGGHRPPGLPKHLGPPLSCATRIPAVFKIRQPATFQTFRGSRPGGHAAMVPATGISSALYTPNGRCLTRRSSSGFGSASWCFHNSLLWMDAMTRARILVSKFGPPAPFENGPYDAHPRVPLAKFKPANTAFGPGLSTGAHVRWVCPSKGRESQGAGRSRIRQSVRSN